MYQTVLNWISGYFFQDRHHYFSATFVLDIFSTSIWKKSFFNSFNFLVFWSVIISIFPSLCLWTMFSAKKQVSFSLFITSSGALSLFCFFNYSLQVLSALLILMLLHLQLLHRAFASYWLLYNKLTLNLMA